MDQIFMLTSAWRETSNVEPARSYTALLGYVRLKGVSIFPRFAWYGRQIEKQLNRTTGLIGYRLGGRVFALEFFHLSAWEDAGAVQAFVHEEPHRRIMQELMGRLGKTEFRYWTI